MSIITKLTIMFFSLSLIGFSFLVYVYTDFRGTETGDPVPGFTSKPVMSDPPKIVEDKPIVIRTPVPVSQISIPKIGINAPIVYGSPVHELSFQVAMEDGVAHYTGTADIGDRGNAVLMGHSSDYPNQPGFYKTVFARLPELEFGDKIYVTDERGKGFVYEVLDTRIIESTQTEILAQYGKTEKYLTLITSFPIGSYNQRYIIIAIIK